MARSIEIDSNQVEWRPMRYPGISNKSLRRDPVTEARVSLMRFEPGAYLPLHEHPEGEEVFVMEGRVRFEQTWYEAGFYLYSPPDSLDDVYSDTGAVILVSLPKPAVHPE